MKMRGRMRVRNLIYINRRKSNIDEALKMHSQGADIEMGHGDSADIQGDMDVEIPQHPPTGSNQIEVQAVIEKDGEE